MASSNEMGHAEIPASGLGLLSSGAVFPDARILKNMRLALADGSVFFAIATFAVWLLSRPFEGIYGDARIYMARALADNDPNGVGRDFMFVFDGQSQFSIFHFIADWLVAAINPANTSLVFAIANSICWFSAALLLVNCFAQGRMKWAILMIAVVLPNYYGPFTLLRYGEAFAVPRPLAEACVLAALAFLIDGRRAFAALFLMLGAAFHPIMTLPGILIFGLDLCRTDRRWLVAGLSIGLAGLAAATLGLPLVDRLTTSIDPDWLSLLRIRNPYLFPTAWPWETFGFLALASASIVLAMDLVAPKVRFVFWSVLGVGLGGIAFATVFGDLWVSLLVVQAQLWRMTWILNVLAGLSFALCLLNVRERGPRLELATALLVFGWMFWDAPALTFFCGFAALLLYRLKHMDFAFNRPLLTAIWALILAAGAIVKFRLGAAFFDFALAAPTGAHVPLLLLWGLYIFSIPLIVFASMWVWRPHWFPAKLLGALAFVAVLCAGCFWDDRPAARKMTDAAPHPADLAALIPADHSEIYWIGGIEPWYLLGHPSWLLRIQGAGIVFSRELSMFWQERLNALISMHLADENILGPWTIPEKDDAVQLTRAAVDRLCARPDAPSTIVSEMEEGGSLPSDIKFKTWQSPVPQFQFLVRKEALTWRKIEKFIVISCTDHVPEQ
jgi:hypothetical protein